MNTVISLLVNCPLSGLVGIQHPSISAGLEPGPVIPAPLTIPPVTTHPCN